MYFKLAAFIVLLVILITASVWGFYAAADKWDQPGTTTMNRVTDLLLPAATVLAAIFVGGRTVQEIGCIAGNKSICMFDKSEGSAASLEKSS